jgi:ankyrin repeat protein
MENLFDDWTWWRVGEFLFDADDAACIACNGKDDSMRTRVRKAIAQLVPVKIACGVRVYILLQAGRFQRFCPRYLLTRLGLATELRHWTCRCSGDYCRRNLLAGAVCSRDILTLKTVIADCEPSNIALFTAIRIGMHPAVRMLLDHRSDPNALTKSDNPWTPLVTACVTRNVSIVNTLLRAGANPNPLTKYLPLDMAMMHQSDHYLIYSLLRFRANVNAGVHSPICLAALENNVRLMKLLVKYDANINIPDQNGMSPLHCGAAVCSVGAVQHLLKLRADVNVCTYNGLTPLQVIGLYCDQVTLLELCKMQRIRSLLE